MPNVYVACGSYDGTVFALSYDHSTFDGQGPVLLKTVFIDTDAHPASVNTLAIGENLVVSGSTDEAIQVFSLSQRARLGCLELHTGTIRHLQFSNESDSQSTPQHLVSAGDDCCLAIWCHKMPHATEAGARPLAWQCVRQMRRHKGPITAMALHPSSRIAFTLSADKTLRVWNLLRGRQAYAIRTKSLANELTGVVCSPSGRMLLMTWPDRCELVALFTGSSSSEYKSLGTLVSRLKLRQPFSVPPVFFAEDESMSNGFTYFLAGVRDQLVAYRSPLQSSTPVNFESLGSIKLPGKRIKQLRVLPWRPTAEVETLASDSSILQRLVVVVTTDADGSYIRGYCTNVALPDGLSSPTAVLPVFTYDLHDVRLTSMDASWQSQRVTYRKVGDLPALSLDSGVRDRIGNSSDSDITESELTEGEDSSVDAS